MFRIEKDTLGEKQVPVDALYGIHALRARENCMITRKQLHNRVQTAIRAGILPHSPGSGG